MLRHSVVLWLIALILASTFAASSCVTTEPSPEFALTGQIHAIRTDTREVVIQHGDITGLMPGMTMPFKVRDRRLLTGKQPGDLVTARVRVGDEGPWLATLEKTGSAPLPSATTIATPTALTVGAPIPAIELTTADRRPLTLDDWRGTVIAITFIYTRCPLPQFCPMMDKRFAELQQIVGDDPQLAGRARLLSISFDPDADRPEVLSAHAKRLNANPLVWTFATTSRDDVDRFAAALGVNIVREADGTITHNLRTAVIDPAGRLATIHNADWAPQQVAADMRRALSGQ